MVINLTRERVEAFVKWGNAYIERLEERKNPLNKRIYNEEIEKVRKTLALIQTRLDRESNLVPLDELKL